ncbi:MAG: hypothetical protein WC538_01115 [Thermoanaerobaculia bacterium]|jgi:pimeloyl-ACP methyl ester carboxylesterase
MNCQRTPLRIGIGTLLVLGAGLIGSGCASSPDLRRIYSREAAAEDLERNPVILIPGLLGSSLVDDEGTMVWGVLGRAAMKPESSRGALAIAVPFDGVVTTSEAPVGVHASGVLDSLRIRLLGVPMEIKAYANVLKSLGVFAGYRDESLGRSGAVDYGNDHYTCFQFPYDWRLDVPTNARRLDEFIEEKAAYVEAQDLARYGRKRDPVKFDVVAHSYGALVLRYYLRYGNRAPDAATEVVAAPTWDGARRVERAILVAPPNAGSLKSLDSLLRGRRFGLFSYNYSPAILGTFPSLYATLPRTRHTALVDADENAVDLFDPEVWIAHSWGLADPKQDAELRKLLPGVASADERRQIALRSLRSNLALAKRTQTELALASAPPPGLTIHLVGGDAEETPSRAEIQKEGGSPRVVAREPGDGTVTRASALMDERLGGEWSRRIRSPIAWDSVLFVPSNHLGMTEDPTFTDNLLFTLLQAH